MNNIDVRNKELEKLFDYLESNRLFSGVVLLSEEGEAFYKRAVGKKSEIKQQTIDAIFEIASISKSFTAVAIMMLNDEKKLRLDDDITKYFPSLPYKGITIKNLLNHTSGLPDYMEWFEDTKNWNHSRVATNQDVINYLNKEKPEVLFKVNEKWEYCNTGYVLLAEIIGMVSNLTYDEFLNKRIFTPLEMVNTSTHSQFLESRLENFSLGYIYDWEKGIYYLPQQLKEHKYVYFFDGVKGDGGIKSTAADLLKWEQAIYNNELLSQEAIDMILSSTSLKGNVTTGYCPGLHKDFGGYGLGWKLENHPRYKEIVLHDGYWAGFCTSLISYKDFNKSIIMLNNLDFTDEKLNEIPHILTLALERILFYEQVNLEEFEQLIN
ncbi:serine hydrolase domain-containing protein [Halobacillus litoralis]|nr:serine hydrolase domain-containing protein [Halobacillus litoralis]